MFRIFLKIVGGLVLLSLLVYLTDFAVWRVRLAQGAGTDVVQVNRVNATPLKGNKEEYYFDGTDSETRSLLPPPAVDGVGACHAGGLFDTGKG